MNIFFLSRNPERAAEYMCNRHVVKMMTESAQILSTAHRILDGREIVVPTTDKLGRKRWKKHYELPDSREGKMYKATHPGNRFCLWAMECSANYRWLYRHYVALCGEYTRRYGKAGKPSQLKEILRQPPTRIPCDREDITQPAMIDGYEDEDPVVSYRNYYVQEKAHMAKWPPGLVPEWWSH